MSCYGVAYWSCVAKVRHGQQRLMDQCCELQSLFVTLILLLCEVTVPVPPPQPPGGFSVMFLFPCIMKYKWRTLKKFACVIDGIFHPYFLLTYCNMHVDV